MMPPEPASFTSGRVALGVDLGSTRLRAAYAVPDGPSRLVPAAAVDWPWPLCESASGGDLPFSFPSVKSRLADERPIRFGGTTGTPGELVTRALRALWEWVEEEAGAGVGQVVLSVPAWLESAQRTALLEAARRSGVTASRLISDSLAAVVGHTADPGSATFLVYGMGYSGSEFGLVRAAHGHFRALACEATASRGGRVFDRDVLAAWARFWHRHDPSAASGDPSVWRRRRMRAELVKERLAAVGGDEFEKLTLGEDPGGGCGIGRRQFDEYMRWHVGWTLERVRCLFARSGLRSADVNALILVGGSTRMEQVSAGVSGLGMRCLRLPDDGLARGALLHAQQISGSPHARPDHFQVGAAGEERAAEAAAPVLIAAVPAARDGSSSDRLAARPPSLCLGPCLTEARRLIERDERGQAADLLHEIITEARTLLESVYHAATRSPDSRTAETSVGAGAQTGNMQRSGAAISAADSTSSASRLKRARSLLEQRRYEEAVVESHAAWAGQMRPVDGPDVFEAMIEIHRAAAMAEHDPVPFQDAERWLLCAHGLDPTNTGLRDLLAEHAYGQAVRLHAEGLRADALAALQKATGWSPEHVGARGLQRRLSEEGPPNIVDRPGTSRRGHDSAK